MLKLFLWLRYLRKRKIVILSIAAVALSTALLIIVASLFDGFIRAFERTASEALGDVVVSCPSRMPEYPRFTQQLEQLPAIDSVTPALLTQGLLRIGAGNVRAVSVWGVDPNTAGTVLSLAGTVLKSKASPDMGIFAVENGPGGLIGIGVLGEPDELTDEYDFTAAEDFIGESVVLTMGTAVETEGSAEQQYRRRVMKFTVADILFTGVYFRDSKYVYVPIKTLQAELLPEQGTPLADQVQIKLVDNTDMQAAMAQIWGVWKTFASQELGWSEYMISATTIETSQQMQARYVAELRKQMGILMLIFGMVSLTAVLLIFCIFYMIVETRRKDIGIVKSCGAGSLSVAMIFVGFGGFIGILGSALGIILGYIVTVNINTLEEWIRVMFGLKLWKSSVYIFSRIPNEVDWAAVGPIVVSAVCAAAVGALIPAIAAAWTRPVQVLRYE
jgi:lipoprotein-releasing system permease protein